MNPHVSLFFFFNDTATTEIYTLSLHDALPISVSVARPSLPLHAPVRPGDGRSHERRPARQHDLRHLVSPGYRDRKSTRLNSSHANISYAVFCLKKKKTREKETTHHNSNLYTTE